MAAYEVVLLWSGICGIVTCFIAWKLWRKKPERNKSIEFSRQAVLEATNKRLLGQNRELKDENIEGPKSESSVAEKEESVRNEEQGRVSPRNQELFVKEQIKTAKTHIIGNKILMKPSNDQIKKSFHVKLKPDPSGSFDGGLDPDTQLPICQPLRSIDDVYRWIPGFDHFSVASIPLKSVSREFPNKPKTLVCHDMRGGYTEDRFIQGFNSITCYRINHWNFIDTFVYFSHNIVTIPPPCWTNSCHRHGVKVLGTFITEWDDGAKYCNDILETKESYERFAKQLVEIACYYNFDGWLINIENKIEAGKIESLIKFLAFLTNAMHAAKQESEIIWYDSVTNQGSLEWQNELSSNNSMFFDVCDGIFLNYTWSVHHLSRSALVAGNARKFDVYVGVDCFGRGCFGGGGWNTYKAMQVIRDQNLSAAIFAPGWVLETQGEKEFTKHQNKFWHLLMSYLYPHVATELPVVSSFCQGYGEHYFSGGKKLMSLPWTNLSCQQLQPTFYDEYYQLGSQKALQVKDMTYCTDDAFEGGGCIKVNGIVNTKVHSSRTFLRLFRCSCKLPKNVFASFTFKIDQFEAMDIFLLFLLDGKPNYIVLGPTESEATETTKELYIKLGSEKFATSKQIANSSYPIPDDQKENYKVFQPLVGETKDRIIQISGNDEEKSNKWISRYYLISADQLPYVKEIRVVCATKSSGQPRIQPFTLLLGELKVLAAEDLVRSFPVITNIRCRDTTITRSDEDALLSTTILWDSLHQQTNTSLIVCYDIYCAGVEMDECKNTEMGVFLGKAFVESYRIANLKVSTECEQSLKIYIQASSEDNMKAGLQHCGILTLEW